MVREGSSHEGNLLSSFAHSSILSEFPTQLGVLCLSPPMGHSALELAQTRSPDQHVGRLCPSIDLTPPSLTAFTFRTVEGPLLSPSVIFRVLTLLNSF